MINGSLFELGTDGVWALVKEGKSSREKSWITFHQIVLEFPETFDKIAEIINDPAYNDVVRKYARSILDYLSLWKFLSWKQFDSIWKIVKTKEEYFREKNQTTQIYQFRSVVNVRRGPLVFTYTDSKPYLDKIRALTDKQMDRFYEKLFGCRPQFEEEIEDGLTVCYDKDGSRYFAMNSDLEFPVI
jgi:hypothetical protein